jgi:prepilin signal peptidase PulO-like enzyme (type II secretory pathway)
MDDYWWIWCLAFVAGVGGCIGSFINVIIYRLPRNVPLGKPRWSFCPNCETTIRWYDNIPIFSYFRLRGHCRICSWPIPPRYVVIEIITLLLFLMLFDAFFVAVVLDGTAGPAWTVSYRFASDLPIYAAHALLFACLLAMSVIDMEHYWLDIRFTHFAALCGFALHALWTPMRQPLWPRPDSVLSAAAILATVAIVVTHLIIAWLWRRKAMAAEASSSEQDADSAQPDSPTAQSVPIHLGSKSLRPLAWIAGLVLCATMVMLIAAIARPPAAPDRSVPPTAPRVVARPQRTPDSAFVTRVAPGILFVFCALVAGSVIKRDSDDEIEEALESERHNARKMALTEFATLLPTIALFVGGWLAVRQGGPLEDLWRQMWNWQIGNFTRPFLGLGTAAAGFIVAGAVGWAVRIFFTLTLGKEAFGAGDIHIMAAAGAVTGWEVVVVGFFLSALLALLGKVLTLPFKRGHALPMGPWLSLGFFLALLWRGEVFGRFVGPMGLFFKTVFG